MEPGGIKRREDFFEQILDKIPRGEKRKHEPDAQEFWDSHNFIKMPRLYAPLMIPGERVLKGSVHENAVIRAPALSGKKRKGPPHVALSTFAKNYFKSLMPRYRWFEEGNDMKFSAKFGAGPPESLTRVGGVACVFVKSYSLLDLANVWTAVKQGAQKTGMAIADTNNDLLEYSFRSDYTWKNLTNVNCHVHFKEFTCRQGAKDGYGVQEMWDVDANSQVGFTNKYSQLTTFNTQDALNARKDIRSIQMFKIGGPNSLVRQYWGTGSKWSVAVVPPGGVVMKSLYYSGSVSQLTYTEAVTAQGNIYVPGMPSLLVKIIGEEIYNPASTSELTAEAADNTTTGASAVQFTTAPVQVMEQVKHKGCAKYIPGYQPEFVTLGTRAAATLGQVGIIADLPYAVASTFERLNGDGNGIEPYRDIGAYTTLELPTDDKKGAEQGMSYMADDD